MLAPLSISQERPQSGGASACRRWAHWPRKTESPYLPLFYEALKAHGVVPVTTMSKDVGWLGSRPADVLHFHWPDAFWRRDQTKYLRRVLGIWDARTYLAAAKQAGLKVVWTAHNHRPHEGGWLDGLGYRLLAREADLIICHTRWSASAVRRTYRPTGAVVVMPHGNFDGVYPAPRPRAAVAELGLDPERPIVSCLGNIRAYKGLELACDAVARLQGDVQLLIAGSPRRGYDLRPLRRAATLSNAVLLERRATDQEFADITAASDAVLLPYRRVTTSGVMLTAWTLGSGVICSDLPFFRELLPESGTAGRLFTANDARSLAEAIRSYVAIPRETRVAAALRQARQYPWATCIRPVVDWIEAQREPLRSS
jgi:glycosyltransferase involved in cell wall biosynthesis